MFLKNLIALAIVAIPIAMLIGRRLKTQREKIFSSRYSDISLDERVWFKDEEYENIWTKMEELP